MAKKQSDKKVTNQTNTKNRHLEKQINIQTERQFKKF